MIPDLNFYLVPSDEPSAAPRNLRQKVLRFLEERGIVSGLYDEDLGWFRPGPRAAELFSNAPEEGEPFEYAIVYEGPAQFVPNAHSEAFNATCAACSASLDEALAEFVALQEEGEAPDPTTHSLTCPACASANALVGLKAEVPSAVTCFYVNVCDVPNLEVSLELAAELEAVIGAPLRVLREHL